MCPGRVLALLGAVVGSLFALIHGISSADLTATVFTESRSVSPLLFSTARTFVAPASELVHGIHPRIAFSATEWETIVEDYAAKRTVPGSWSKHFLDYTQHKGPGNQYLNNWAVLDTSAYTGEPDMNPDGLKNLAEEVLNMSDYNEGGFFMYALHAAVNEERVASGSPGCLPQGQNTTASIAVIVNYAKVVLAHYATYGCSTCTYRKGILWSDLWKTDRAWGVTIDWYTGGLGVALSYDVLYNRMSAVQRRFVRSALALMVKDRQYWGITDTSDRFSPNALLHPHRIFGNWATYHANLYLTNLAIEGETDFDTMTTKLKVGFNTDINKKTIALFDAFMKHSIYPDGSTFEDGYTYSVAMREGSLGFVALARRGHNHLDTPRFRNFIHNAAQMHEPYRCGNFIGHASGGGLSYPTFYALARFAYPHGTLPNMLWRQRMGAQFVNNAPCRIDWHQVMMQMAILGGEHAGTAESPAGLSAADAKKFPLSVYQPRRGLLIARSNMSENALYLHFDARPDAFFPGHDNADRGDITLTALGRTWLDSLHWWTFPTSQHHSLMHIDGQAQAVKAPCVRMLKVTDDGTVVLAAADLTYAYNVQWSRPWAWEIEPAHNEVVWTNGVPETKRVTFPEKETGNPRDFGWPTDDDGSDLGFTNSTSLWGEPNIGFFGLYNWKRDYRQTRLSHGVRSTVLVRGDGGSGYVLIGDDYVMSGDGQHTFDSYLILASGVSVKNDSACSGNRCKLSLTGGVDKHLDVHVVNIGMQVSFRVEAIEKANVRLVVSSSGRKSEQFCLALHPHSRSDEEFALTRNGSVCTVKSRNITRKFQFSPTDHSLEVLTTKPKPKPMTPILLPYNTVLRFRERDMNTDNSTFYNPFTSDHQVVLQVRTHQSARRVITTCRGFTRSDTKIWLYYCGNDDMAMSNYNSRSCTLLSNGEADNECSRLRAKLKHPRKNNQTYFAVVSAKKIGTEDLKFDILYK